MMRNSTNTRTVMIAVACVATVVLGASGCSGEVSGVDAAEALVTAKERALEDAQEQFTSASESFCAASADYITALDRYGDVLSDTAPTVGDVRAGGADLAAPREGALDGAEAAVEAHQAVVTAQTELIEAEEALAAAQSSGSPVPRDDASPAPSATALAPAATVERVTQAESDLDEAQGSITDATTLVEATEQFNSAAVAVEFAWMRLFLDAGCLADEDAAAAHEAASAYVTALQQDLADVGLYEGAVDGIYGPQTVEAIEALQEKYELPVTGTVDRATALALQAELLELGVTEAQESIATTAVLQQRLTTLGFWDGPVDGLWTPEFTEAVEAFQEELGVEPTGEIDAATVKAVEKAFEELGQSFTASATPTPTPSASASA